MERDIPAVVVAEDNMPEFGAGSEYGYRRRKEAKQRKLGILRRAQKADDFPWVLREGSKKKGKTSKWVPYFCVDLFSLSLYLSLSLSLSVCLSLSLCLCIETSNLKQHC